VLLVSKNTHLHFGSGNMFQPDEQTTLSRLLSWNQDQTLECFPNKCYTYSVLLHRMYLQLSALTNNSIPSKPPAPVLWLGYIYGY
jgi:hypothetical protein